MCLNAPTGAWCSLTTGEALTWLNAAWSQCTYRCVVLPDRARHFFHPDAVWSLNAPTGAWCSLTLASRALEASASPSQCTYRCVVLPDLPYDGPYVRGIVVSMHLQVRGAP